MNWLGSFFLLFRDVFDYVTKGRRVELPPDPRPLPSKVLVEIDEARRRRAAQ